MSDALVIVLATGLCLVPVSLAATRLWLLLATLVSLAWLGASGLYFYVYLGLGGDDTWPLGILIVLWLAAIAAIVARRLAMLASARDDEPDPSRTGAMQGDGAFGARNARER